MNAQALEIRYNDDFDRDSHPVQDWQREVVAVVYSHFLVPDESECTYYATIHGGIFAIAAARRSERLYVTDLAFLAALPGFRWVESTKDGITVGLSHVLPV